MFFWEVTTFGSTMFEEDLDIQDQTCAELW